MAMPNMGCLHKQEEIVHSGGSSFRVEDRKRKNVSCLSKIPRVSTLKILENITYLLITMVPRMIAIAVLTVSHTTMGSKDNGPVNGIRQKVGS